MLRSGVPVSFAARVSPPPSPGLRLIPRLRARHQSVKCAEPLLSLPSAKFTKEFGELFQLCGLCLLAGRAGPVQHAGKND
jgi:hypothetical protein